MYVFCIFHYVKTFKTSAFCLPGQQRLITFQSARYQHVFSKTIQFINPVFLTL